MVERGSMPKEPLGGPVCLSTRRKSPTRRVDSIDSEGMRKGWTQKVMMKMAMTMMEKRDWTAGRKPWVSWVWWCGVRCRAGWGGGGTASSGPGAGVGSAGALESATGFIARPPREWVGFRRRGAGRRGGGA